MMTSLRRSEARTRSSIFRFLLVAATGALLVALAASVAGARDGPNAKSGAAGKRYRIALSMTYVGNDWQAENRNGFVA